jgi:hypothetical protein
MKPNKFLSAFAGISVLFSPIVQADSNAPGGSEASYELKNRSSFRVDPDARAPFWPIGWQRPKKGSAGQPVEVKAGPDSGIQLQPGFFNVTSILLGHPPLAMINGRSFEEGEVLPVVAGSQRLRVLVRAIRDGGVWLEYERQQVFVPMRRPELGTKQTETKAAPSEFTIKIPG